MTKISNNKQEEDERRTSNVEGGCRFTPFF